MIRKLPNFLIWLKRKRIPIVKTQSYLIIKKLFILKTVVFMKVIGMSLKSDKDLEHIDGRMDLFILDIGKIM